MSNVHLSNGSPAVERMDARLSDQPKPSACRRLFEQYDREELKKDFKGHLRDMEIALSEKWNFDFPRFTPHPDGRYLWTIVDSKDMPSFYSASERQGKDTRSSGNNSVDVNGNHDCVAVTPCRLNEEKTERAESQLEKRDQHVKGQRKRPSCLDSSCQAKRPHTCLDEVSRRPGLTQTVDHTPKKSSPPRQT